LKSQERDNCSAEGQTGQRLPNGMSSLLDMLCSLEGGDSCDEDEAIPPEEIQQFRANQSHYMDQRDALRQRLRTQFHNMQQHRSNNPM